MPTSSRRRAQWLSSGRRCPKHPVGRSTVCEFRLSACQFAAIGGTRKYIATKISYAVVGFSNVLDGWARSCPL
eukprot:4113789-Pyramimonas_sp.AAC.1